MATHLRAQSSLPKKAMAAALPLLLGCCCASSAEQVALAHTNDDIDSSLSLFESSWAKDKTQSLNPSRHGMYAYEPIQTMNQLGGFKILLGERQLLSRMKPKSSAFEQIWLVHPFTKVVLPTKTDDPDRLASQVVGTKATRSEDPFVDINGDGRPELVVGDFSGGAHCCFSYKIYSLGVEAKLYDHLDGNDQQFLFADVDGDGKVEAIGYDFTFAYWNTDFADSPAPLVMLRPTSTGFKLATDLMSTPGSGADKQMMEMITWTTKAIEIETSKNRGKGGDFSLSPELWKNMLNLIYTGHSTECWSLLDFIWPSGKRALFSNPKEVDKNAKPGSKEEFMQAFLACLRSSPYWDGIKKLNNGDKLLQSMH